MQFSLLASIAALSTLASAHFEVDYPFWRGDSFATGRSQYTYPCAGVSQENSTTNRTAWPLDGGSLQTRFGHPWAFTYVNLGLGNNVTSFNVSLVEGFNQTGNGTFCMSKVGTEALAALGVKDGTQASIQVVQIGHTGSALYNCADIVFNSSAKVLSSDQCKNSTGVGGVALMDSNAPMNMSSGSMGGSSGSSSGSSGKSAAAPGVYIAPSVVVAGLAVTFCAFLA